MLLGYCTNIHPAETWEETFQILEKHVMEVRNRLITSGDQSLDTLFPIGLRLSAIAAKELLESGNLAKFKHWLEANNSLVFTINGFPYGSFHGTRVKEQVFKPDWTTNDRLDYTKDLFRILAYLTPTGGTGSISTLPGSHKSFAADESLIRKNLIELAYFIEELSQANQVDLHLGLEPEPLGHFENTEETLSFFKRLFHEANASPVVKNRIGLNYDCCHFAIEFDHATKSLEAIHQFAGIRLSKIHLSNAISLAPSDSAALEAIRAFDEPTYFHQVILQKSDGSLERFMDLPDFFESLDSGEIAPSDYVEARVHFHIPLDTQPMTPLGSTSQHVDETLTWFMKNPGACEHFEIETYTWGILPDDMQRPVEEQIAAEYRWVLSKLRDI